MTLVSFKIKLKWNNETIKSQRNYNHELHIDVQLYVYINYIITYNILS